MARVTRQPFRVYRVGGSVRDELLGRSVGDRDWVVVGATPEMLVASGYKAVGADFPVFLHPETREEYALARTERKHGRGYRGFEFFASPEVTLEEDLARRDLTINAMARDEDGNLIDPYGGQADLAQGILRHVSPAFVEDPLRVLRVARFAARFGFAVASGTRRLMRKIVASGELATLAPERVWAEISRGLCEPRPSRMLTELRACGALAALLPEIDGLYGARRSSPAATSIDAGTLLGHALDWAAARELALAVRYAVLAHDLADPAAPRMPRDSATRIRLADGMSERLRVPIELRDAARLAARWYPSVARAAELPPAAILDLLQSADALRRPERLATLLDACAAVACSLPGAQQHYPPKEWLLEAWNVVRRVDAGSAAREASGASARDDGAVANAVRAARLTALREWKAKPPPA
jgi:tRNA nucleotidyltransferase (CCA-adding enzyme)